MGEWLPLRVLNLSGQGLTWEQTHEMSHKRQRLFGRFGVPWRPTSCPSIEGTQPVIFLAAREIESGKMGAESQGLRKRDASTLPGISFAKHPGSTLEATGSWATFA